MLRTTGSLLHITWLILTSSPCSATRQPPPVLKTAVNTMRINGLTTIMRMKIRSGRVSNGVPVCEKRSGNLKADALSRNVLVGQQQGDASATDEQSRGIEKVRNLIDEAIHMKSMETPNAVLSELSEEYRKLNLVSRQHALLILATEYGVDRANVQSLIHHYLSLQRGGVDGGVIQEGNLQAVYRIEQHLRSALTPLSARLFKHINWQPFGLKFLVDLRADLRAAIEEHNRASFRTLDIDLKEILETTLGPAGLELRQITWNDPASLLEKIVAYEAVHPISNLYDLRRRLGSGRRCFGYFHPSIQGEPLIFIEVALTKTILDSIQEVLWERPPIPESDATTALFYSISSTQPGLAGINLGKFLIKRVVRLLQQEMPAVQTFATLSPIPGFMPWLLSKLAAQSKLVAASAAVSEGKMENGSTLSDNLLFPSEGKLLLQVSG